MQLSVAKISVPFLTVAVTVEVVFAVAPSDDTPTVELVPVVGFNVAVHVDGLTAELVQFIVMSSLVATLAGVIVGVIVSISPIIISFSRLQNSESIANT